MKECCCWHRSRLARCPIAIDLFDANQQMVAVAQVNYLLLEQAALKND